MMNCLKGYRLWLRRGCRLRLRLRIPAIGLLWVIQSGHMGLMVASEQVGVYIQGNRNTTVPELLLDVFGVGSLLNQETRVGMSQVVEPDFP